MRRAAVAAVLLLAACGGIARAPGAASGSLISSSPFCSGVPLLAERSLANLGVFEWRRLAGGVRPEATGLTGALATGKQLQPSPIPGGGYLVAVEFEGAGSQVLDRVLAEVEKNVPPDRYVPPEGHLGIFVALTQDDLDHWPERQARLMQPPVDGGKLVDYPISIGPDGRHLLVFSVGADLVTGCSLSADAR
jgi:hypothetical protein